MRLFKFITIFVCSFIVLSHVLPNQGCGAGLTACPNEEGQVACCPFENGVCCSDQTHCCPTNHACHPGHPGRCVPTDETPDSMDPMSEETDQFEELIAHFTDSDNAYEETH